MAMLRGTAHLLVHAARSHASLTLAATIVCHCRLETTSGSHRQEAQYDLSDNRGRAAGAAGLRAWVIALELRCIACDSLFAG
jgi:hypothetical protein